MAAGPSRSDHFCAHKGEPKEEFYMRRNKTFSIAALVGLSMLALSACSAGTTPAPGETPAEGEETAAATTADTVVMKVAFNQPDTHPQYIVMGEPQETRHLVVADQQAVISPSWSVHSGVGTASYSFVWAMAGENQSFDDMDGFAIADMR